MIGQYFSVIDIREDDQPTNTDGGLTMMDLRCLTETMDVRFNGYHRPYDVHDKGK